MDEQLKQLYSEETEKRALGCMFLDGKAAELGKNSLKEDDFYQPMYREIFKAMQAVKTVDVATVWNELQRRGEWERVGLEWLAKVNTSVASSVNMRTYAEELQRLSFYRRTLQKSRELLQAALSQDDGNINGILSGMQKDGYGDDEGKTLADGTGARLEKLAAIRASGKRLAGLTTGFDDLDAALGGLRDGDLDIIAARPSMGKSALALDIARNAQKSLTEDRERVAVFSLEMSAEALGLRGYTAEYLIDNDRFSVGQNDSAWMHTLAEVERNSEAFEKGAGRILISDRSGMTLEKIRGVCHKWQTKGYDLRLIVIDYLQLIQGKGENRTREIGEISRGLKRLAKDLGCPVLALSQLSRKNEERADKRPMLSDLRESGDIEQDADVVMLLHREDYYFPDCENQGIAEVIIAKQREGPTGTIRLRWLNRSTTFRSLEKFKSTTEEAPEGWD
jgi:replicative DNA helicase